MSEDYFIGVDARELDRLKAQHAAWRPETEALWGAAGFGAGRHIADLGCGPGFAAMDLARIVGDRGHITAIDNARSYVDYLRGEIQQRALGNVSVVQADVTALETDPGEFDGAFCRFFLAFLIADLDRTLAAIHRSLRPGGGFAVMEYLTLDSTAAIPAIAGFDAHTRAWVRYYERHGGDTSVGQHLPGRLERAGFTIEHRTAVGGMADPKHRWWTWWGRLIADFGEKLVREGLMSAGELRELEAGWRRASANTRAVIHTPLIIQIVARKAA